MNFSKHMVRASSRKLKNDLDTLKKVMIKSSIPEMYYSIGSYMEEAICIEQKNKIWIVYEGERGKRYNLKTYKDIRYACHDFLSRVSESNEQEKMLIHLFNIEQRRVVNTISSRVSSTSYSASEAIAIVKKHAVTAIDETIAVSIRTGCDSRQIAQQIRGAVVLPNNVGESVKVLVFAKGRKIAEAQEAGADYVGGEELIAKILNDGWSDFDVVVATPDMMGVVGRLGKVLGPKGLMPNPKAGTVTMDITKAVKDIRSGKIQYRFEKQNTICVPIGKASFSEEELMVNYCELMDAVKKAKPSQIKGPYLRGITFTSTKGSKVRVNLKAVNN